MSDIKCPFCGRELGRKNINDRMCSNEKCVTWKGNFYGSEDLWQELIRTRKDLEIATKAFEMIRDEFGIENRLATPIMQGLNMKAIAENALKQIEHKEVK